MMNEVGITERIRVPRGHATCIGVLQAILKIRRIGNNQIVIISNLQSPFLQSCLKGTYAILFRLFYCRLVDVDAFHFRFRATLHQHPCYQSGAGADIEYPDS